MFTSLFPLVTYLIAYARLKLHNTPKTFLVFPVAIFSLLLAGCQTTGDPRQGGLFGWSEEKAIQRQVGLETQLKQSEQRQLTTQKQAVHLQDQKTKLTSQAEQLKAQIQSLRSKNQKLVLELEHIRREKTLQAEELARLEYILTSNRKIMAAQVSSGNEVISVAGQTAQTNQMKTQNQILHREISALLKR